MRVQNLIRQRLLVISSRQRGFALAEVLIALAVFAGALTIGLRGISGAALGLNTLSGQNQAEYVAVSQLEYVEHLAFASGATTYPLGVTVPAGLSVSTAVQTFQGADSNLQQITVTVSAGTKTLATVYELKANRP